MWQQRDPLAPGSVECNIRVGKHDKYVCRFWLFAPRRLGIFYPESPCLLNPAKKRLVLYRFYQKVRIYSTTTPANVMIPTLTDAVTVELTITSHLTTSTSRVLTGRNQYQFPHRNNCSELRLFFHCWCGDTNCREMATTWKCWIAHSLKLTVGAYSQRTQPTTRSRKYIHQCWKHSGYGR